MAKRSVTPRRYSNTAIQMAAARESHGAPIATETAPGRRTTARNASRPAGARPGRETSEDAGRAGAAQLAAAALIDFTDQTETDMPLMVRYGWPDEKSSASTRPVISVAGLTALPDESFASNSIA